MVPSDVFSAPLRRHVSLADVIDTNDLFKGEDGEDGEDEELSDLLDVSNDEDDEAEVTYEKMIVFALKATAHCNHLLSETFSQLQFKGEHKCTRG
jgi:hypothetical protein